VDGPQHGREYPWAVVVVLDGLDDGEAEEQEEAAEEAAEEEGGEEEEEEEALWAGGDIEKHEDTKIEHEQDDIVIQQEYARSQHLFQLAYPGTYEAQLRELTPSTEVTHGSLHRPMHDVHACRHLEAAQL
jgi:hypothetical protein